MASYAANSCTSTSDLNPEQEDNIKLRINGLVLYKPWIIVNQNDNINNINNKRGIIGWEIHTATTSTEQSVYCSISTLLKSYKNGEYSNIRNIPFIHHFLPAHFPHSVCPSYTTYASYCFLGSIAGSAAMVLSTQALLIAVGVGSQTAAPMAAALNWVMKDGIGQLGGIMFASQLGQGGMDLLRWKTKLERKWLPAAVIGVQYRPREATRIRRGGNSQQGSADTNPKRWRMVAAMALDVSTLLEICTPMMGPEYFLPCASIANIGKNVGFLAASASRAAIHQSLSMGGSLLPTSSLLPVAVSESSPKNMTTVMMPPPKSSSNLGDVTAKSGSQSIVASLLGTAVGIFFSQTLCSDHGTVGILAGFVALSTVHQMCTYKAVKAVPLRSFNRHRLHLVLSSYIFENANSSHDSMDGNRIKTLTPAQVAEKELFLPFIQPDVSCRWLYIGDSLVNICPSGVAELENLLLPKDASGGVTLEKFNNVAYDMNEYEKYILKIHCPSEPNIDDDMIQLTFLEGANDYDILRGMYHSYVIHAYMKNNQMYSNVSHNENTERRILMDTHKKMTNQMPMFIECLQNEGWHLGTGLVNVECGSSNRLKIQSL